MQIILLLVLFLCNVLNKLFMGRGSWSRNFLYIIEKNIMHDRLFVFWCDLLVQIAFIYDLANPWDLQAVHMEVACELTTSTYLYIHIIVWSKSYSRDQCLIGIQDTCGQLDAGRHISIYSRCTWLKSYKKDRPWDALTYFTWWVRHASEFTITVHFSWCVVSCLMS